MPDVQLYESENATFSQEIQTALKSLLDKCELEDQVVRLRHVYEAKRNDLYWHGFQHIFWDSINMEFRIPTHEVLAGLGSTREEATFVYDYVTNVFKAHGLSIIAAMGAEVPGVAFYALNPDNPASVRAARQAEKLAKVIHKVNNSKLIIFHALFILYTQHLLAAYNYFERDKKYGEVDIPQFKKVNTEIFPEHYSCAECGMIYESPVDNCIECGGEAKFNPAETEDQLQKTGTEKTPLGMSKLGIYGVLNIRVPSYAPDQDAIGYLIHYSDQHISYLRYIYPDIRDQLSVTSDDVYERHARGSSVSQIYNEASNNNLLTLKRCWFRPWQYEFLDDPDQVSLLRESFPQGCYVAFAGDTFSEAREEDLDDVWTLTKGDLSRFVHGDPLGKIGIEAQDLRNTTTNLLVECLEHSVPTNFAESEIFSPEKYSINEIQPGAVYQVKKPLGYSSIGDAFFSLKTATLPKEGTDFQSLLDQDTQFLLGSFPSVFGGPQEGSKTLGEYTQSRNYALQRLSIPYQMLYFWWAYATYKAVKMYVKNILSEESHVLSGARGMETAKFSPGDFVQEFGVLIPESAVELPVTFGQKRFIIEQAIQQSNPDILEFLFSPENFSVVMRYMGIDDLVSPEELQARKQLREIAELLKGKPQETPEGIVPSLFTDPEVDDDEIHLRIVKNFLCSDAGQDLRLENPEAYQNCLAHAALHKRALIMQQMQQMQAAPMQGENPNAGT